MARLDRKLELWEHQLLDLGKRNRMINYRETKRTTIKLVEPSFDVLFSRLAVNEEELTFQRPVDKETDIRVYSFLALLENLSSPLPVSIGDIKAEGSIIERQKTLKAMRNKARISLEEQGVNILYLSFGFIEWREGKGANANIIKSPLILVPAVLTLESLNSPFTLSKHEDDIVVNPTLSYLLRTEYGIELPEFDADIEGINDYLQKVEEIADQHGWRILKEVSLGLLSFLKISMYNDLRNNESRIKENPVIRAMAGDSDDVNAIPAGLVSFDLDSVNARECYQVMSADSSQQAAILYSKRNVSFVMQGPPGTGKSQTITNIIAEALADGKKVLFVSEKMAALQVVYRRLQDAHLGDFCLPLHSYKANKREILEQLGVSLKLNQTCVNDAALADLDTLSRLRSELNAYAHELHQIVPELNISCYDAYSKLEATHDVPSISFVLNDVLDISQADLQNLLSKVKEYELAVSRLHYWIKSNPWEGLKLRAAGYDYSAKMQSELNTIVDSFEKASAVFSSIQKLDSIDRMVCFSDIPSYITAVKIISSLPKVPEQWLVDFDADSAMLTALDADALFSQMFNVRDDIATVFTSDIYQYDYEGWKNSIHKTTSDLCSMPLHKEGAESQWFSCYKDERLFIDRFNKLTSAFYEHIEKLLNSINSTFTKQKSIPLESLQSSLRKVRTIQEKTQAYASALSTLNEYIKTDSSLSVLSLSHTIPEIWKKSFFADNLDAKSKLAGKLLSEIDSTKKTVESVFQADIYQFDLRGWNESLSHILETLSSMSLIVNASKSEWISHYKEYESILTSIKNEIVSVCCSYEIVNSKIGVALTSKRTSLSFLNELISLINPARIIPKQWMEPGTGRIKEIVVEAKGKSTRANELRNSILASYEKEILDFDYEPILVRYKTDYTSVLRIFNKQYRKDRDCLRSLSRTVVKKIADDAAVDVLTKLKEYKEITGWFGNNADRLLESLSSEYYRGISSEWDDILQLLDVSERIKVLFENRVPTCVKSELSCAPSKLKNDLSSLVAKIDDAFTKLEKIITSRRKDYLAININEDNLSQYLPLLDEYSLQFEAIDRHICTIRGYVVNDKVSTERAIETLETIEYSDDQLSSAVVRIEEYIADFESAFESDNIDQYIDTINSYNINLKLLSSHYDRISPYLVADNTPIDDIYTAIYKVSYHSELKARIIAASTQYSATFGHFYCGEQTDWKVVKNCLEQISALRAMPIYPSISVLVNAPTDRKAGLGTAASELERIYTDADNSYTWISEQFCGDSSFASMSLDCLLDKLTRCQQNINVLDGWIDYLEAIASCESAGLGDFIKTVESAEQYTNLENVFLKGVYTIWLGAVCDGFESVRRFRKNAHEERVESFGKLDNRQLRIAQMRIREKLIENLPNANHLLKANDEVAILKRELEKKRRIMPLRKLFRQIPNLLMRLKPCLMMSPLSVAYFLETDAYQFDLVIFDEASQIFPEDAIGAIFRGSQVIIAGDSKQLPPTNFFSSATSGSENDYDTDDDEDYSETISDSILEESASVLPNLMLLWHYRSRHESLISFSNREIYRNGLITFPCSNESVPDTGVEYIYVEDGYYQGGGKNCNIREAQRCVELVLQHIMNYPQRSLGIIAFSEKQQTAIENTISEFREAHPEYEWFFDESKDEPFFVKNLENVQGDERDTIIFSICYARDRQGKMYMRFGPLGNAGGERRLNVAITRAKYNVKLVGSILPTDIDLNRTNSEGVRMLRSYIEFARKGDVALRPAPQTDEFETSDYFCDAIAAFIMQNGYDVVRNVGNSDYTIDIAVKSPDRKDGYIAGVECDGISYRKAQTARDRDHLRRSVLQSMGWNMYRVWSTEWFRNTDAEKEALLSFLKSAAESSASDDLAARQQNKVDERDSYDDIAREMTRKAPSKKACSPYDFAEYKKACWVDAPHTGSWDNLTRISETVHYIVSVEQPIHIELLYKRMGPSFTAGKATEAVCRTVDEAISEKLNGIVLVDSDRFVRMLPLEKPVIRVPKNSAMLRPMEYIHTEEVAEAMIAIIRNSFGLTEEDLSTECAHVFGFERKGAKIKQKTDAAIAYLTSRNIIKFIDNKVQLTGEEL